MSYEYDAYLKTHKANVKRSYDWIRDNLPELICDSVEYNGTIDYEWQIGFAHDASKENPEEYGPYDAYFYGGNRSAKVVREYQYAWLNHVHFNPHHWQYWVLLDEDPREGVIALEMPYNYILEMICDWWSFCWSRGKLTDVFDWYEEHKEYMQLHPNTRKKVEHILMTIRKKLENDGIQIV